jgi:hypothetical protein
MGFSRLPDWLLLCLPVLGTVLSLLHSWSRRFPNPGSFLTHRCWSVLSWTLEEDPLQVLQGLSSVQFSLAHVLRQVSCIGPPSLWASSPSPRLLGCSLDTSQGGCWVTYRIICPLSTCQESLSSLPDAQGHVKVFQCLDARCLVPLKPGFEQQIGLVSPGHFRDPWGSSTWFHVTQETPLHLHLFPHPEHISHLSAEYRKWGEQLELCLEMRKQDMFFLQKFDIIIYVSSFFFFFFAVLGF